MNLEMTRDFGDGIVLDTIKVNQCDGDRSQEQCEDNSEENDIVVRHSHVHNIFILNFVEPYDKRIEYSKFRTM